MNVFVRNDLIKYIVNRINDLKGFTCLFTNNFYEYGNNLTKKLIRAELTRWPRMI